MSSNFLGIDFGSKRVGLAIASSETHMAQRLNTLLNEETLIPEIIKIINDNEIGAIILGLPRNLEGDDTAQTSVVRDFSKRLKEATNLPVILQDEALTSEQALEHLKTNHSGTIKKDLVDAEAAAIILQDYLDSL